MRGTGIFPDHHHGTLVGQARQVAHLLDHLQNRAGQTLASVYSIRPKPGASVSTPLDWDEVRPGLDLRDFNITTVPQRVKKKGDLFKGVLRKPRYSIAAVRKELKDLLE